MGVKKKRETQVTSLTVCHQDLETLKALADVEGQNLASLLLHCVQLTDGVSQICYVKQIVPLLEKANKNGTCDPTIRSCLDILAGIYLSLNLKNPLKKVLASSLNGLPEFFLIEATQSFTSRLQEELNTSTDLYSYRKVIDNVSSCMENFDLGRSSVNNLLENEVMGDQSLVPYASDLLETMFKNHKSRLKSQAVDSTWIDKWHETWVSPLLRVLCEGNLDQKSYVIDYYLPKLLNCNPESLSYMVKILQTSADAKTGSYDSRGAVGALMACLRTARAHGHLQSATDAWRDLVSSARIKQGLIHQHCQAEDFRFYPVGNREPESLHL
ncbi:hypothetical protein Celaphus_00005658 [Cervus elaphus hippelaphus]|uniref:tRNA (32-2'-O)-methyltransferase regulator THADA-like TPR repeats region domain-containing protein n=1 Tax=Cervus elaphus hippelaphus TaxID=46360 RepID=A0A212CXW9_CEREH|nr:hypothetical protein Celaphus_00005658 [Cervus elaphus hippelaphus]